MGPCCGCWREIDRPNFGLIYEPANLLLCGQPYGRDTLRKFRPHLMNVYVQNHRLDEQGPLSLTTFCRGEVRFHHLDPWEAGGVDFAAVSSALKDIGYRGLLHDPSSAGDRDRGRGEGVRGAVRTPFSGRCNGAGPVVPTDDQKACGAWAIF